MMNVMCYLIGTCECCVPAPEPRTLISDIQPRKIVANENKTQYLTNPAI